MFAGSKLRVRVFAALGLSVMSAGACGDGASAEPEPSEEVCNGVDDDLDGQVDEYFESDTWYRDDDNDGYGDPENTVEFCAEPSGYVRDAGDCDDSDDNVRPDNYDSCDGTDNDCDGLIDTTFGYVDQDGDGYPGTRAEVDTCQDWPEDVSTDAEDCDDTRDSVSPGAAEVCGDGIDTDCDGRRSCLALEMSDGDLLCRLNWSVSDAETSSDALVAGSDFEFGATLRPTDAWSTEEGCPDADAWLIDVLVTMSGDTVTFDGAFWLNMTGGWADDVLSASAGPLTWEDYPGYSESWVTDVALNEIEVYNPGGRPFTVDGAPRLAPAVAASAWVHPASSAIPRGDPDRRDRAAARWAAAGRAEHASVASFARFALELMALAAPPELLVECSRAMAEEVRHARLCFGLAEALGARASGVGPLPVRDSLGQAGDPAHALVALISEGCVGETVSAALAEAALEQATEPAVRQVLAEIVDDEGRHSAYAWRCARWLLQQHPELRPLAARTFREAETAWQTVAAVTPAAEGLQAFGLLDPTERHRVGRLAWSRIVEPAAQLLLDGPKGAALVA